MPIPSITALPTAPDRSTMTAAQFSSAADAWVAGIDTFTDELNAFSAALVEAAASANYSATSTTSVTVGTGAKNFTIQDGKMFVAGQWVQIVSASAPTTQTMYGTVTSYNSLTGALVVDVVSILGAGNTKADWIIGLSGPVGPASGTTLTNPVITGTVTEDAYTITDGAAVDINPENGSLQNWTLGANRTPTAALFSNGQNITLRIADGAAYAVNWSTISPTWVGGSAPTLPTSGWAVIEMWKDGGTLYAAYVGNVA